MAYLPGEQVVWHTGPILQGRNRSRTYDIAAEVLQDGQLRVRIRITFANGETAMRWVKPVNVQRATPEWCGERYPD